VSIRTSRIVEDPSNCTVCGRPSEITIETPDQSETVDQSRAGTFCLECAAEHISKNRAVFALALLSIIRSGIAAEVDRSLIRDMSTTV
jgi:hypothetical protein